MVASFLTSAEVAELTVVNQSGHATKLALAGGGTSLVLARWSDVQQDHIAVSAQTVVVAYAGRQEQRQASESAEMTTVDGWFEKLAPFDVEVGDLFALGDVGDEMRGSIVVVLPAKLGVQRAGFRLRLGEL